jgi:hypothetical protein
MRNHQSIIDDIWRIFQDEGVHLPQDLLTSSIVNDNLNRLLEDELGIAYSNGRFDCNCEGEDYWS